MESLGGLFVVVGSIVAGVGLVWAVVWIVRENPVLGILCLFVPLAALIVLVRRWPQSRKPLAFWGVGVAVFVCGLALSGRSRH